VSAWCTGAARDAELGRERPRRRNGVTRPQRTAQDAAAQSVDELHADRLRRIAIDDEDRSVHGYSLLT
jgi:hypothetical protein